MAMRGGDCNVCPSITENYSLGLQVGLDKIDSELKKLWAQSEGAMTRASLVNLAVYSEVPGSLKRTRSSSQRLPRTMHVAPSLLALTAKRKKIAWKPGSARIVMSVAPAANKFAPSKFRFCSKGHAQALLPSIVFSHLDSDLPFYLWWQGEFREPMDPQLWAWVDRVIYDSQTWKDFRATNAPG